MNLKTPAILILFCLAWAGCSEIFHGKMEEEKDPHYLTGKSRLNAMNYAGAIEAFHKALKVNPHSSAAHFELGLLYYDKPRVEDPSAAIYHLKQFLNLQPDSPKRGIIEEYIQVCKRQLAREVTLAPVTEKIQNELDQLIDENNQLRQQALKLKEANQQLRSALSRQVGGSVPPDSRASDPRISTSRTPSPRSATRSASERTSTTTARFGMRKHRVAKGDNPYSISRQYNISLDAFRRANPGVKATQLQIGQLVNVPQR